MGGLAGTWVRNTQGEFKPHSAQMEMGWPYQPQEKSSRERFLDRSTMLGTNMLAGPNDSGLQSLQNRSTGKRPV